MRYKTCYVRSYASHDIEIQKISYHVATARFSITWIMWEQNKALKYQDNYYINVCVIRIIYLEGSKVKFKL